MDNKYKVIGITGGIASGKSTVSDYIRSKGYPVLDADIYARKVVEPGSEGLKEIVEAFGEAALNEDGTMNRQYVGSLIFNDKEKRDILNGITHPKIRQMMNDERDFYLKTTHVFQDIPLLFENGLEGQMDEIIVVYVERDVQTERLMSRNELSESEATSRIESQMSLEDKKARATVVFDNTETRETLYKQIDEFLSTLS
ncbi:dephospho-CoA kinase [Phocicoccus schoeneichii]|uniref:Dephospho-CoA kinase n=1 Tax=Phocicoccus schoeneichii TaxID=1812261 RepID=A0A6V7RIN6_9BACL|nr:dephospho-CoA kinase [Jeotgalicoccus schoeneichii]GGH46876.1 dephospho-CoA kinase [Jeotgalicoccus schoeneichii]CAD2077898.1 Dephospho-CoA kinase [Jeotgalicoccus schoeneichii]